MAPVGTSNRTQLQQLAGHSPTDVHPAEARAGLASVPPTCGEVLEILDMLPSELPARGEAQDGSVSFTAGSWSKDGQLGLRANCTTFPAVTRLLCSFVRAHAPHHSFGAVALFCNLQATPRRDVNNEPSFPNLLLPVSQFAQGQVWQQDDSGPDVREVQGLQQHGILHDVASGPCYLDAQRLHFTLPWRGRRVLVVAFTPRGVPACHDIVGQLLPLGFNLPVEQPSACMPNQVSLAGYTFSLPQVQLRPIVFDCAPSELIALEVFAGRARLSVAVRDLGLSSMPVDHQAKCPDMRVTVLDLTDPNDLTTYFEMLCTANIGSGHWAPPCGTASRARERPLPPELSHIDAPPLRSPDHRFGLPDLAPHHAARVEAANWLYAVTLLSIWVLHLRGSLLSCENPTRSLIWRIADVLAQDLPDPSAWFDLVDNIFHACMYGSRRDKLSTFKATPGFCRSLNLRCDGNHEHESWTPTVSRKGVLFPTLSEAEYTAGLAQAYASDLHAVLLTKGVQFEGSHIGLGVAKPRDLRSFTRKRVPPLLAEYWLVAPIDCVPQHWPSKPLKPHVHFPKRGDEVRIVRSMQDVLDLEHEFACKPSTIVAFKGEGANGSEPMVGVLRTPKQTLDATALLSHPLELHLPLPDQLVKAVINVLRLGPKGVAQVRKGALNRIAALRDSLEPKEAEIHRSLHPDLRKVLQGKNTLLWQQLLHDTGFPDPGLIDEVREGFELVGPGTVSGAFPKGYKPPEQSVDQLKSQCTWRKKAAIAKCGPTKNSEADQELWDLTMEEVAQGWVSGPFWSESEVTAALETDQWLCTRRFPVIQGPKVRVIDDCLQSGVNSAYTAFNKLRLMDADAFISLVLLILQVADKPGSFVTLDSGERLYVACSGCLVP